MVLLGLMLTGIVVQCWFHLRYYRKLITYKNREELPEPSEMVSVVVCARAEKENLIKLLPRILEQNYPSFELIVVDDASWDGTRTWLEEQEAADKRVKGVYVTEEMKKNYRGKKLALSLGIKASKGSILLLTDADCLPASENWIARMTAELLTNPEKEIVLGYSPFYRSMHPVNLIARMDNAYTALNYMSLALAGNPYMGVGRNLCYRKELFFRNKGFASHLHIAPGDDDLFVNEVANERNTAVCLHPESFVHTYAKKTFGDWFRQKKRHNFAGRYYKNGHRFVLASSIFSHALLWSSFCLLAMFPQYFGWALIALGIYWLVKWPVVYYGFKKLGQQGIAPWMPVFDLLWLFYNAVFGAILIFGKQKKW